MLIEFDVISNLSNDAAAEISKRHWSCGSIVSSPLLLFNFTCFHPSSIAFIEVPNAKELSIDAIDEQLLIQLNNFQFANLLSNLVTVLIEEVGLLKWFQQFAAWIRCSTRSRQELLGVVRMCLDSTCVSL